MALQVTGACAPVLDPLLAHVAGHVADGVLAPGAQLAVRHRGDWLVDAAVGTDGLGRPMLTDTRFALYCSGKPLAALAVAHVVERGGLTYDAALGDVLGDLVGSRLAPITVTNLLTHTAGLHHLTVTQAILAGPRRRRELALRVGPPRRWTIGRDIAYAEHGAWELLGRAIAATTGIAPADYVREHVLAPLDLADDLSAVMTGDEYDRDLDRLGVNVYLRANHHIPLLLERTRAFCTEEQLGYGARGSARALAGLYAHLAQVHAGATEDGVVTQAALQAATAPARPRGFDRALGRDCDYGLGFMVGLSDHGFGRHPSPTAFGHSGYAGGSFGFADPVNDLAVALVYNGYIDADTSLRLRREAVVGTLYRCLGIAIHPPSGPT